MHDTFYIMYIYSRSQVFVVCSQNAEKGIW
jgi:hypothetical protein